jgi:hypothetical protein
MFGLRRQLNTISRAIDAVLSNQEVFAKILQGQSERLMQMQRRLEQLMSDLQTKIDAETANVQAGNSTLQSVLTLLGTIKTNIEAGVGTAKQTGDFTALDAALSQQTQFINTLQTTANQLNTDVPIPAPTTPPASTTTTTTTSTSTNTSTGATTPSS